MEDLEAGRAKDILSCISAAGQNVHVSLLNAREVFDFFHRFDELTFEMASHLSKIRFPDEDPVFINLTLLVLAQRQMRNAFAAFLRFQSYDGQLLFRPGVECAIFAYRIFETRELAAVWINRDTDFKKFSREFRRKSPPERMPRRQFLQQYLDDLNDYRAHPNILYLAGWFEKKDGQLRINYFDQERIWWPTVLMFLHVAMAVVEVFRTIFRSEAKIFVTDTDARFRKLQTELSTLTERRRKMAGGSRQSG